MKKLLVLFFIVQWVFSYAQCVKEEATVLKKVLSAYIDYTESFRKVDKNNEILILQKTSHPTYPIQIIGISFYDFHLLIDVPYTKIFDYNGYKLVLVSNDSKNFEKKFKKYFKSRKFEQINKGKNNEANIDFRNISISLNNKLEVVSIYPEDKGLIKNIVDNKLVISKDCTCLPLLPVSTSSNNQK